MSDVFEPDAYLFENEVDPDEFGDHEDEDVDATPTD